MTNEFSSPVLNTANGVECIEVVDNHIYFYAEITPATISALMKHIRTVDNWLAGDRISQNILAGVPQTPIWLHVNSHGGEVFASLAAADLIQQTTHPVYTVAQGAVLSGGTILALAGARRFTTENCVFLIHQISEAYAGTHEQFQDLLHSQKGTMQMLVDFYHRKTDLKKKKIKKLLKRDSFFSAHKAIEWGFADDYYYKALWEG